MPKTVYFLKKSCKIRQSLVGLRQLGFPYIIATSKFYSFC